MASPLSRLGAAVLAVVALLTAFVPNASAADPAEGTVSPASPVVTWTGGTGTTPSPDPTPIGCTSEADPACDFFALTVDLSGAETSQDLEIAITSTTAIDYDLFVYDSEGTLVTSGTSSGPNETVLIEAVPADTYAVAVKNWSSTPVDSFDGSATLIDSGLDVATPGTAGASANQIDWAYDPEAPQVSAEVPLRVVMVGFDPDDPQDAFTAEEIFQEIPDAQRPGSLYKYGGGDELPDDWDYFGADTLVNHARAYYVDSNPFLLPIEYRWKPELIYAPDAFADGLFGAMMENSFLADVAGPTQAQFIEAYNETRGSAYRVAASGDPTQAVAPASQQRMVEAERIEDWIAANAEDHLGFDADNDIENVEQPPNGGPRQDVGYTVFYLNTWDSDEALEHFPAGEYHNWYIERIDPDDGKFDGIDWARIWGGRYRFMMVDTGAAPNVYEEQTWAAGDPVTGSTLYDPPLWEYRANAPRPVTGIHLADGVEQAITPGETWDREQLGYMMARTLNQAVNFRFLHSYLYEPRPGTGRFYLSDNVWHDSYAEAPWPTDLNKLYNQEVALNGLRSLTPYFEFDGDVAYEYLADPPEGQDDNYTADQAALEQAKADGDSVAGASYTAMNTVTMMDYLDANPERFHRGGGCFTTVPVISAVVQGHYAWALPVIVAGIAENRNGVPWGFLQSVNDVSKWDESGRDDVTNLYHYNPRYDGTFTYTVVHEASHYLGLAHPHDTIGAVRGEDGEPAYYRGFAWTYNSTASPTTYSHVELQYGILDQESIARGHTSYYLTWVDEALSQSGVAFAKQGITSPDQLPANLQALRATAIAMNAEAEQLFARFDFVGATFAAQAAWEAAADLHDAALDLEPGTSELEKSTALGLDADVADCAGSVDHDHGGGDVGGSDDTPTTGGGAARAALLVLAAGLLGWSARRRRWTPAA